MPHQPNSSVYLPQIKTKRSFSPLWIIPILSVILAIGLVIKSIQDTGEHIQIYFSNAQGLVAGRTSIRYQGLEVGMVKQVKLAEDLNRIYVDAQIYPSAKALLSPGTRFWLVKPSASLSGISGLDALVSGNYIALHPDNLTGKSQSHPNEFHALDTPPSDLFAHQGLVIQLQAQDLSGVRLGSQILYKKIPIGEVFHYELNPNTGSVIIYASVKEEYRSLINSNSRFWNVSGLQAELGLTGVNVQLDSLSSLLNGAIAVDSPENGEDVEHQALFHLYPDLHSAGRGTKIQINLPQDHGIKTNSAILYQGVAIGKVLEVNFSNKKMIANAIIEPHFNELLTENSRFVLEEAQISLDGVRNLNAIINGNFLRLIPADGKANKQFTALREQDDKLTYSNALVVRLKANNALGLAVNTPVLYRGVMIGHIAQLQLTEENVDFTLFIEPQYQSLIRSQNRFYVTEALQASWSEQGVKLTVSPLTHWVKGSISFISQGKPQKAAYYDLYENYSLAQLAQHSTQAAQQIRLLADRLPPVQINSPLLYRNLTVGKVTQFELTPQGFEVVLHIEPQYQHLINEHSVFWNHSGIAMKASLTGIDIQSAPLASLLQGAIAFDDLPQVANKTGKHWKLYPNYQTALTQGEEITLQAPENLSIPVGTPIKYQGIHVGEIVKVTPNFQQQNTQLMARIQAEYASEINRTNSQFWVTQPKFSLDGNAQLDSLLTKTIEVRPGKGAPQHHFTLIRHANAGQGVTFILQSETQGSLRVGAPVLYRGMSVGEVSEIQLGALADRVMFSIEIEADYAYLVRENSVFWNASGVDIQLGLSGAAIKTGTIDSLLRGGIQFATPTHKNLASIAPAQHAFYLHAQAPQDWQQWKTLIPNPSAP